MVRFNGQKCLQHNLLKFQVSIEKRHREEEKDDLRAQYRPAINPEHMATLLLESIFGEAPVRTPKHRVSAKVIVCLLYTSDAADE